MYKILNWFFGSFFRTLGRLMVFILIGFILAQFINFKDIKITDLLGFEKVNASTFTEEVTLKRDMTLKIDNTSQWGPNEGVYFSRNIYSNDEISQVSLNFTSDTQTNIKRNDYIAFNFILSKPFDSIHTDTHEMGPNYCVGYQCNDFQNGTCLAWGCEANTELEDIETIVKQYNITDLSINARVVYGGQYNNQWASCTINGTEIWCPTYKTEIKQLFINYWFKTDETKSFGIGILRNAKQYDSQDLQNAINNQSQQQHQDSQNTQNAINGVNDSITNSNTSEANDNASGFFDNFTDNDHGLSSIITAPLRAINSMLNDTCVAPGATYKGKTFSFPCGSILWSRPGGEDFRNFINVFYGGFLAYFVIRSLFFDVEKLKNPNNDKVEVEKL